jgi:hypothetical protein
MSRFLQMLNLSVGGAQSPVSNRAWPDMQHAFLTPLYHRLEDAICKRMAKLLVYTLAPKSPALVRRRWTLLTTLSA